MTIGDVFRRHQIKHQNVTVPPHLYELNDLILHQVQFALHGVRCVNEDIDAISTHFPKEDSTSFL